MHDLVPARLRKLVERLAPGGTRIVDQDVQLVLAPGEFRGQGSDLIRIGDVGGYGVGFANLAKLRLGRSEEHTSELQSLMRISYAVFCLKKKKKHYTKNKNKT